MVAFLSRPEMVQFERRIAAETEHEPAVGLAFLAAGPHRMKAAFAALLSAPCTMPVKSMSTDPELAAEQFASMCKGMGDLDRRFGLAHRTPNATPSGLPVRSTCSAARMRWAGAAIRLIGNPDAPPDFGLTCHSPLRAYISYAIGKDCTRSMNDNNQPEEPGQGGPNPWVKSLMMWGGIFLALLLVVSMFGNAGQTTGTQIGYSDFREPGRRRHGRRGADRRRPDYRYAQERQAFTTVPVANDAELTALAGRKRREIFGRRRPKSRTCCFTS